MTWKKKKSFLYYVAKILGYPVYRLWFKSLRIKVEGAIQPNPCIVAFFHQDIFTAIGWLSDQQQNFTALVSPSRDGEYLSILLKRLGFDVIRGSTHQEPLRGFWQSLQGLREGSGLLITPDGPRGPAGKIKEGIFKLAEHSGASIFFLSITYSRYRRLKSWDRFVLPQPFSHCHIQLHGPIKVSAVGDCKSIRQLMESLRYDS